MQYLILAVCVGVIGFSAHFAFAPPPHAPKYYAVEKQTLVRPERFEGMKYHDVEQRTPASEGH